jgi:hypothetical protein
MFMLPGENILYGSTEADFVVTSHRIRVDSKRWGQAQVTSIMLEELCSSELKYSSLPLLFGFAFLVLLLGGIGTLLAYTQQLSGILELLRFAPLCGGLLFAMGLVFIYFMTRRMTLVLASAGSSIALDAMRLGVQTTKELIDIIEAAKDYRYSQAGMVNTEFQPEGPASLPQKWGEEGGETGNMGVLGL